MIAKCFGFLPVLCLLLVHSFNVQSTLLPLASVECPDKRSACPQLATCCATPTGAWGCCPLQNAVCCSDKKHCCPSHTTCDVAHLSCNETRITLRPLVDIVVGYAPHARVAYSSGDLTLSTAGRKSDVTNVCPGTAQACPFNTTCCATTQQDDYECCPLPGATCCADGLHCCPHSTTCDLTTQKCVDKNRNRKTLALLSLGGAAQLSTAFAKQLRDGSLCPDKESTCADGSTCCQIPGGGYGCCPYRNATCCSDGLHCCPASFVCDVQHAQCKKQDHVAIPFFN